VSATDRRGLAEIVAWLGALVCVTAVIIASLVVSGHIDPEIRGLFIGLGVALAARGTKGAIDRDALRSDGK
jgi:hypothetical protein